MLADLMAKVKTIYTCQECGAQRPRWEGRCSDCGTWNSMVEEKQIQVKESSKSRGWALGGGDSKQKLKPIKLSEKVESQQFARIGTGLGELDRVLGGGLVSGSYILVGGDPGIGKSTLLLQMAGGLANTDKKVLYVSAEESMNQTALRAQRLGVRSENVEIISESVLENIVELARAQSPNILVVDSIQTVYTSEVASAPGSVSQVRECAGQLMSLAKNNNMCIFIVGHVTKDGSIAGPRVLEHMVDTVLSFEGDNHHQFRLLRAIKNRFGATNELGVFQMYGAGLKEVDNPSEFFLEERNSESIGSAIYAAMEGSRPLLCEIQALSSFSVMSMPRRTAIGFDTNRVHMLLAVLDKYLNLNSGHSDVYINVVGGLRISEPSADLAVAAALLSSAAHKELSSSLCFFGEVGLTGEIRAANFCIERIREAEKLGFKTVVLPESNKKHLHGEIKNSQLKFEFLKSVKDLERLIGRPKKSPRPRTDAIGTA